MPSYCHFFFSWPVLRSRLSFLLLFSAQQYHSALCSVLALWLLLRFFLFLAFSNLTVTCLSMVFLLLILLWFIELLEYVGWCLSSYQEILIFNHYFFKYCPSCPLLFIWAQQRMYVFIVSQIPLAFLFWFLFFFIYSI